ncbi:hypothetical protein [Kamptonema formosum]|uniref:hypothetical protein n=1 Tax=Kamptonema formosum TaxID=331992 RepID=UPI000345492E|nr:hypothetical protein [Oscillatoria sp. PCC 10802]
MNNEESDRIQLKHTLTALIAEHGFREVAEVLRDYALASETEIGLPAELSASWQKSAQLLGKIVEAWEEAEREMLSCR